MLACLVVGLDQSPQADAALEQAVILARRLGAAIVAATVVPDAAGDEERACAASLVERGAFRATAAGLVARPEVRAGPVDLALSDLTEEADALLVGRRGRGSAPGAIGAVTRALVRAGRRTVIACGPVASSLRAVAVVWDGRGRRPLEAARVLAGSRGTSIHVLAIGEGARAQAMSDAEAVLSGMRVVPHLLSHGGDAVAGVVRAARPDALCVAAAAVGGAGAVEAILAATDLPLVIAP